MTESTQRLSDMLKHRHPDVDWSTLARFQNVLVHDYLGIDLELIWRVIQEDLPVFRERILNILDQPDPDAEE